MAGRAVHRVLRRLALLSADQGGAMIIALAVAFPVVAGLAFLAIDTGRYYNLHTSLQSAADAYALAGAAELDRRPNKPDAIERATRAIHELVANDQRFGDGAAVLTSDDISMRFLRRLSPPQETTDPRHARFVEVQINPLTLSNPTIAAVLGIAGPVRTNASATAGFEQAVCEFAPFFICNPFEGTGVSIFDAMDTPDWRRRLFALRDSGGSQWTPGNFGFLAAPGQTGASALAEMMAVDRPPLCFTQSTVKTEPGANTGPVRRAINVRFDIYDGNLNSRSSDPRFRPARNVRKGYGGQNCNQQAPGDPEIIRGLPRDDCFADNSCKVWSAHTAGRIGNGDWNINAYWQTNYGSAPPAYINGKPWEKASRYDVYLEEINGPTKLYQVKSGKGNMTERGTPICYSGDQSAFNDPLDRRLLNAAVIDCIEHADSLNGRGEAPVTAFARLFLTEPVDDDKGIFAEMIGLIEPGVPGAETMLRDIVQLYR